MRDLWTDYWQDEATDREDHAKLDVLARGDGLVAEAACPCGATAVTSISLEQVHAALSNAAQFTSDPTHLAQLRQQGFVSCACVPDRNGNSVFAVAWLCGHCGKPAAWEDNPFRPFCSERCRLIDLGNWAAEKYRIPGALSSPEEAEEPQERPKPDTDKESA